MTTATKLTNEQLDEAIVAVLDEAWTEYQRKRAEAEAQREATRGDGVTLIRRSIVVSAPTFRTASMQNRVEYHLSQGGTADMVHANKLRARLHALADEGRIGRYHRSGRYSWRPIEYQREQAERQRAERQREAEREALRDRLTAERPVQMERCQRLAERCETVFGFRPAAHVSYATVNGERVIASELTFTADQVEQLLEKA